jgi:hypothetical protein
MEEKIVHKYQPSGRVPFGSLILMLMATIVGGIVIGAVVAFVDQYIYLIFVFPLLMGVIAGGLIAWIVRVGKVRSPFVAILFGILIAAVVYGVYHYGTYYLERQKIVAQISSEQGISADAAQSSFDAGLQNEVGATGFIGYKQFVAKQGITFVSTTYGSSSDAVPIQGNLVYVYWAVEFLIIVLVAAGVARQQARKAFCENCHTWYAGRARIGTVDRKSSKQFISLLRDGNFAEAKAMFIPPARPPRTDLEMDYCKTCQTSDVLLTAKRVTRVRRNGTNGTVAVRGAVSRQQLTDLLPVSKAN